MSENLGVDLHSGTLARRLLCAHPDLRQAGARRTISRSVCTASRRRARTSSCSALMGVEEPSTPFLCRGHRTLEPTSRRTPLPSEYRAWPGAVCRGAGSRSQGEGVRITHVSHSCPIDHLANSGRSAEGRAATDDVQDRAGGHAATFSLAAILRNSPDCRPVASSSPSSPRRATVADFAGRDALGLNQRLGCARVVVLHVLCPGDVDQ